jgi:hypothetical protein
MKPRLGVSFSSCLKGSRRQTLRIVLPFRTPSDLFKGLNPTTRPAAIANAQQATAGFGDEETTEKLRE